MTFDHRTGTGTIRCLDDGAIKRTFGRLPHFFPHNAAYGDIYRDIADADTSGMYWGERDVNSIATYLARYALYTPHIVVANPFCDRMLYHVDVSPIDHPGKWQQVVANRAMFLLSIEPWVREGIVTVLPTLKWSDWKLHDSEIAPRAKARTDQFSPEQWRMLEGQSMVDMILSMHPRDIRAFVTSIRPNADEAFVARCEEVAQIHLDDSPARYAWSGVSQERLVCAGPGNSLEAAIYQATLCRSYLLLGQKHYRDEYEFSLEQGDTAMPKDEITRLSKAFATLTFTFLNNVPLDFVLNLRRDNRLSSLRLFLHETWKKASTIKGIESLNADAGFREAITDEYQTFKREWKQIKSRLRGNVLTRAAGTAAAFLSGQFLLSVGLAGIAGMGLQELVNAHTRRKELERLPLAIFLQLERSA